MTVAEKVKEMIIKQLDSKESEVVPEARFIDDLGADSLDMVLRFPMKTQKRLRRSGMQYDISKSI
jgi:hypothetical protein